MSGRRLTTEADLQAVSDTFFSLTHVSMPLEYLRRGTVEGWYIGNELAAAFACITEPPYRVLSVLPEDQLDAHLLASLRRGLVCELNGAYIRPEFKQVLNVIAFVKTIFRTFVATGKECALFGYNKERDSLSALYQRPLLNPVKLLDGQVVLPNGLVSVSNVFLGYFRADHIAKAFRFRCCDGMHTATSTSAEH
jgi:hypothetical protein